MRLNPRLSRYDKRLLQAEKKKHDMGGSGIYVYENNTDADLKLPKPTESGIRTVGPRKRFQGDSYFLNWVGSPMNLLRLIDTVVPRNSQKLQEQTMNEKQLLLDQPDTITHQGKIERVIAEPVQTLTDNTANHEQKKPAVDVLLNENPLDGLEIIVG